MINLANGGDELIQGLPQLTLEGPLVGGYDLIDWDSASDRLVFSAQGPRYNLNLCSYSHNRRELRQLTFVPTGGIPQNSFVEPRHDSYTTFDGLKIPVLIYEPVGRQGPAPTVVYVHGGPESQEKARFNIIIQYLVNHGLLVLAPNVRGSSGYGKRWIHLDDVEKRLDSVKDLEYLVKWSVGTGLSGKETIGIIGGSYGGFMVLSAITEFPDLWAAAGGHCWDRQLHYFSRKNGEVASTSTHSRIRRS